MNSLIRNNNKRELPDAEERVRIVDDAVRAITPGNKVNLMIYDGELFYVHKNEPGTLYFKEKKDSVLFSTCPLDLDGWEEVAQNRLLVYKDGKLICTGQQHHNTYVHDERKMALLYFDYSGL